MCQQISSISVQKSYGSVTSTCADAEPLAHSRLAQSLSRGKFAEEFGEWKVLGSGGYGTVVKAWHLKDQRWYAVKMISTRVRAEETVEDNLEAWSGPQIFHKLHKLHSPHIVKYVRFWSELPNDLPCLSSLRTPHPSPKPDLVAAPLVTSGAVSTRFLLRSTSGQSEFTDFSLGAESDGGFEWATATDREQSCQDDEVWESLRSPESSPKPTHFRVVVMEQMEYIEGVTLASWLAHPEERPAMAPGTMDSVLDIFTQVMKGVADMHAAGIVHCDVKPSNIMIVSVDAKVKFFDFGTAKMKTADSTRGGHGSRAPLSLYEQEGSYTTLGTPGYAAPEHCTFRRCVSEGIAEPAVTKSAGPGADIFSAGVILVELLMATASGGVAFMTGMERALALAQVRTGRTELPSAILRSPGIDGWLRQLCLRMLVWDAMVRPSAEEVLDEIEAAVWAATRHNPMIGTSHPRTPQVAAMLCHFSAAHNPYIGYFVDHRR